MTIQEAYLLFLTKVNRNLKSNNVIASKDRFVLLYNEQQIRRIEYVLDRKNNDSIREAQHFLVTSNPLTVSSYINSKARLDLPVDYMDFSSAYAKVSGANCKGIKMSLWEIKDFDTEEIVDDDNNKPSLSYREAPFYVGDNSLQVFVGDFTLDHVIMTYYKYPQKVDMSGYEKPDGTASVDINPEGDDAFVQKVINMCAESFFVNYGDANSAALNKDRVINNN